MVHFSTLVGPLLAASGAVAQLNSLGVKAGLKYVGTAVGEGNTGDSTYMSIVNNVNEFGGVTPENGQKWDSTEPSRGQFSYGQADIVPNIAKKNGQVLRCHTLVWENQLPNWVSSGSWTSSTLQSVIQTHISNVVGHFKGQCYAWDVVNEAIDDNANWRSDVFYNTMGTDYFPIAYKAAAAADPNAKLYYNDYNLESNGAKTNKALSLVTLIKNAGARIDGVGFQGHLVVGQTPSRSDFVTLFKRFTALGVEVAMTELDIRFSSLPPSTSGLAQQGNDYASVFGGCVDVDGCVGVTVWEFTDKYSWVPGTFSGAGAACLYDSNFNKKPAWTSVSSVLAAAATGGSTPSGGSSPSTTSSAPAVTTTAPPSGGGTVAQWGQCGGINYSGSTTCASGFTCHVINPYYSQCY